MEDIQNNISAPNFDIVLDEYSSLETNLKTWNELLSTDLLTSQQLIESYFTGSLNHLDLNIDYSTLENFVHFSSATERLNNFKYKLELIEMYESNLEILARATGSIVNNVVDYFNKRSALIAGFDSFEKYLYNESGSMYTHLTGSIKPWPKQSGSVDTWKTVFASWNQTNTIIDPDSGEAMIVRATAPKYTLCPTTSSEADDYFISASFICDEYDRENIHALIQTVPEGLRDNGLVGDFEPFVHMIGHHFDIIWSYVSKMTTIYSREEHPQDGIPTDLLFDVTKAFGWELAHGRQSTDLWKYTLGVDESGSLTQNANIDMKPTGDVTTEIWRRILNNLPFIQRTKGTERSVRAMISCYGVPATLLRVNEYGGPANPDDAPHYTYSKFNYATKFTSGASQSITGSFTPRDIIPKTIEMRFKQTEPLDTSWREIFSVANVKVETQKTGSAGDFRGNTKFTSGSSSVTISDKYIFDGAFNNIAVTFDSPTFKFYLKKLKYGKFVIDETGSFTGTWGGFVSGSAYTLGSKLTGSIHEFRLWSEVLTNATLEDHAYSPGAYNGNTETSSFDALLLRAPLTTKIDLAVTSSLGSIHPDQSQPETVKFINMNSGSFEQVEEMNYLRGVSLGEMDAYSTNKVRIVDNQLRDNILNTDFSNDTYVLSKQPIDTNTVGVYFSPQNIIDEDIFSQLGGLSIDDYIGNPRDEYVGSYPDLALFSAQYWKKYSGTNVVSDYIRFIRVFDFSMFQQIKKLLPLRSQNLVGLLIEPNVLERSKLNQNKPEAEDLVLSDTFTDTEMIIAGESDNFTGVLSVRYADIALDVISHSGPLRIPSPLRNIGNTFTGTRSAGALIQNMMLNTASSKAKNEISLPTIQKQQIGRSILTQVPSRHRYVTDYFYASEHDKIIDNPSSSSLSPAEGNDYRSKGMLHLFHGGSSLTGPGVNIDSSETIDGGPVVSVWASNPNLLLKKQTDANGNLIVT